MTPEITIIISVGPKFPTSESHSFQFFKQNSSCPDFDAASPWEPFGKFNVVATGGTVKVPPSGPQTGHATLRVPLPFHADPLTRVTSRPIRTSERTRMSARWDVRASLFTLGSAQVARVCRLLSFFLLILRLQKWMMMVLFAWNAQRLNWLTTPPPFPTTLTLLLQFP